MLKNLAICFIIIILTAVGLGYFYNYASAVNVEFPYFNAISDTEVSDYDVSTAQTINFVTTGTSTIQYITISVAGTCDNTASYPRIELGAHYTDQTPVTGNTQQQIDFMFPAPFDLGPGTHSFKLVVSSCAEKPRLFGSATNPYATTSVVFWISSVEQTDLPFFLINGGPDMGSWVDSDLDPDLADFNTVRYLRCVNGLPCNLTYSYNDLAVGDYIYLTDDTNPNTIYSLKEIPDGNGWDSLTVPNQTTTGKIKRRMMLVDPEVTKFSHTITIDWFESEAVAEADLIANGAFDKEKCDDVCADIATTTGWWDDVRYGIECGMRNVSCWAFVPASTTYDKFLTAQLMFQYSFPMNIYQAIKNGIVDLKATSTATTTVPVSVTLHQTPLDIDLLDLSSFSTDAFYPLVTKIREIFSFILSIFVVAYSTI